MVQEYRVLTAFVRQVQRGLYRRQLTQSGVLALTVLLAILLLGLGVQWLLPWVPVLALAYSVFTVLVLLATGYRLWPMLRRIPPRQVLSDIEQTFPDFHDDLTNALELNPDVLARTNPHGIALDLVQALHRQTVDRVRHVDARPVLQRQTLYGLPWCSVLLLTTLLVGVWRPHMLWESVQILFTPLSYLPSGEVHVAITPERVTIAHGMNLEIRAQVRGRRPKAMQVVVQRPDQDDKSFLMEPLVEQDGYRYIFLKPQQSFTFHALADGYASSDGHVEVVPAPAIGKMTLQFLFPNYTGLPSRTQEGGGDIQALPGTQVQLTMQANVPLTKGSIRLHDGQTLPLDVTDNALRGGLLVMKDGTYTVEVEDTHGLKNMQPPHYTIQVLPDRLPTITLRQPQDGLEVDETTVLQVQYEAEDDFGLQDAALVYFAPNGTEQRIPIRQGRFDQRRTQETVQWDMQQWLLPAGDTVQFYLEVYDNDTISGPKKGVSQTLTLKVRNREQEHAELEKMQEDVANTLLDLLADHLELANQLETWREQAPNQPGPSPEALQQARDKQQAAMERAEHLAQQVQNALNQVQRDPYSTYETFADLQALQRNMAYVQQTLMPQLQESMQSLTSPPASPQPFEQPAHQLEEVVQELERLSSLAERMSRGEKFNDLLNLSTKMMEQQNKLLSAMDNLPKDFHGGELPPELREMLDKLDAMMRDLANAIAQMPTTLPDEFLNRQLDALPLADMMQQLQEMRQKLAAGDMEGAKKLAEQLLKALSEMVASLQNMRQQAQGGAMDAMSQQLQQSSDKLSELIQRQERLLQDTQDIDQQTVQQLNQAQQRTFEALQDRLQQDLNKLSKLAGDMSRQARQHPEIQAAFQQTYQEVLKQLQALRQQLEARDVPQAGKELEALQQQLAWMKRRTERLEHPDDAMQRQASQAVDLAEGIRQQLNGLPQDRQAMLNPEQQGQLSALAEQQGGVQQDTQALQQAFDSLLPLMPFLPAELGKNLQEAAPFMGQAQGELAGRQSQGAIPPEQQALEHLRNAQNGLQQALQQMAQRGQMMGMSMPMLRQAGRLPLPDFMPQPGMEQSNNGMSGSNVRNFQLPDKEAYKAPRMFREDIMEALKEGYPERYKELIEQYYRNIVR